MVQQKLFNPINIASIYSVANSPLGLYQLLNSDFHLHNEALQFTTKELINQFITLAKDENTKGTKEIALLYALLVAIGKHNLDEETRQFFNSVKTIQFEWFSKLAEIILNQSSYNNYTFYIINTDKQIQEPIIKYKLENPIIRPENYTKL